MKNFIKEVQKGLKQPVYLIYSEEPYLLGETLSMVKKTVPEGMREFSLDIFDAETDETSSIEGIKDILRTVPFGGGRRVVAIENLQTVKEKDLKKLGEYIKNPAPESLLVLLYKGTLKKTVRENFGSVRLIPLTIRESDMPFWIKDKAHESGLEISEDVAQYLIGTLGAEPGLIASELKKFTLIGKPIIEKEDIRALIRGFEDYDAFDLIEALKKKDKDKVMRIYRAISGSAEPYSLLGALNWHLQKSSEDPDKLFPLLSDADIKIKTSGGAYPMEELLYRLLKN